MLLPGQPDLQARCSHAEAQDHAHSPHLSGQTLPDWRTDARTHGGRSEPAPGRNHLCHTQPGGFGLLCLVNLSFAVFQVDSYDPLTETWCSVSPLPTAIFYPEAAACGSLIYALGSEVELTETFNPLLDCFFCYDAQRDQWSRLVAEFAHFFHATLIKAVCNEDTLHLCDLSTYKVSPAARDQSVLCLCFKDAALPLRSTGSVQRPANGKVKGHLSVQGSMLGQWGRGTVSTSWVETIHLMRSPMMFRWAK